MGSPQESGLSLRRCGHWSACTQSCARSLHRTSRIDSWGASWKIPAGAMHGVGAGRGGQVGPRDRGRGTNLALAVVSDGSGGELSRAGLLSWMSRRIAHSPRYRPGSEAVDGFR